MPKLVRLYLVSVAIGVGLSAVFTAMMVGFDVANLRHLILETEKGWLAALMMVVFNTIVFGGVQFAIAVMRLAEPEDGPRGGLRQHADLSRPVRVEARATSRRR